MIKVFFIKSAELLNFINLLRLFNFTFLIQISGALNDKDKIKINLEDDKQKLPQLYPPFRNFLSLTNENFKENILITIVTIYYSKKQMFINKLISFEKPNMRSISIIANCILFLCINN